MKLEHFLTPYTKINSKWIKDLNIRPETIKLLEENRGRTLSDINHSKIPCDPPPRVMEIKTKINKWYIIKLKIFSQQRKLSVQFSSFAQSCLTLCDTMNCSTPGLPVHHQLPEFTQTHVQRVDNVIQPSHSLSSPSPPALNLSQHQCLFKWVSSLHQVAKVLEFQLQHQPLQWILRTDLL